MFVISNRWSTHTHAYSGTLTHTKSDLWYLHVCVARQTVSMLRCVVIKSASSTHTLARMGFTCPQRSHIHSHQNGHRTQDTTKFIQ